MISTGPKSHHKTRRPLAVWILAALLVLAGAVALIAHSMRAASTRAAGEPGANAVLKGAAALGDWTTDAPGVRRLITVADLPKPYDTLSVDNGPHLRALAGARPRVPDGFKVDVFATGVDNPRLLRVAPNGDLFIAESGPGRIRMLRNAKGGAQPEVNEIFAAGLNQPFGIAFYPAGPNPQYLYVGNTDSVVRFPYQNGDVKARGNPETIVPDLPAGGRLRGGGHWTRDVVFSKDGQGDVCVRGIAIE